MNDSSPDVRRLFGLPGILIILCILFTAACTAQYPLNPKAEKIDREATRSAVERYGCALGLRPEW